MGRCVNIQWRYFSDVDECNPVHVESLNKTVILAGCDQLCNNTPGNYTCSCNKGYRLLSDGKQCEGKFTLPLVDIWTLESYLLRKPSLSTASQWFAHISPILTNVSCWAIAVAAFDLYILLPGVICIHVNVLSNV